MINWLALFERCHFTTTCRPAGENAVSSSPIVGILPPLRGSNVNIAFSAGYVRVDIRGFRSTEGARYTHGWGPYAAMRLSVAFRAESLCDD